MLINNHMHVSHSYGLKFLKQLKVSQAAPSDELAARAPGCQQCLKLAIGSIPCLCADQANIALLIGEPNFYQRH